MLQESYRVSLLTLPGHGGVPVLQEAFTMDQLTDSIAKALGTYNIKSEVESIAIPVLLVAGREDPVAPPEKVEALTACIPGATVEVIGESGHQPPAEQASAVFDVLTKFFRKVT